MKTHNLLITVEIPIEDIEVRGISRDFFEEAKQKARALLLDKYGIQYDQSYMQMRIEEPDYKD
jgi:hypothetical protein